MCVDITQPPGVAGLKEAQPSPTQKSNLQKGNSVTTTFLSSATPPLSAEQGLASGPLTPSCRRGRQDWHLAAQPCSQGLRVWVCRAEDTTMSRAAARISPSTGAPRPPAPLHRGRRPGPAPSTFPGSAGRPGSPLPACARGTAKPSGAVGQRQGPPDRGQTGVAVSPRAAAS